jgi:microcystin-dependent protein
MAASAALVGALAGPAAAETTGTAGGGLPINNYQPTLVLNQMIALGGVYPGAECVGCQAANTMGMIHTFASPYSAFNMPAAAGQVTSIATNTALFSLMGTTYGGNGASTFGLPDLTGRVAVGRGFPYDLGERGGAGSTFMTLSQLPEHDHGLPGGGLTGAAGDGAYIDNRQPYLALNYQIVVDGTATNDSFLGSIGLYAGASPLVGGLPADGRLLPISEFAELHNLIGTTYGGDGEATFALPNLQGRAVVGTGNGLTLGQRFGEAFTTLTEANLPDHDHSLPGGGFTDLAGGALAFDNAQPSLALNYFINVGGAFPSINSGFGAPPDWAWLGEVVAAAGDIAPQGWVRADGQLLMIDQYQSLFTLIGTTFGGDGETTFALPDLRGRAVMGAGAFLHVGDPWGARFTTLTEANLAPHAHSLLEGGGGGPAIPEPSAWVLMITGFGLAGAGLRRRAAIAA